MPKKNSKHKWEFKKFFRAGAYSWKGTALASKRIKSAVKEIKNVAKKDSVTAAEGAVAFIEKCWRAIEHIDSSSGAIGIAVSNALSELAEIIAHAELSPKEHLELTKRIWESWEDEELGYYDVLGKMWSEFCAIDEILNYWADEFLPVVKMVFQSTVPGSYFKGVEPCLACLYEVGRHDEIIDLLKDREKLFFDYRQYEIKVIAARGDLDRALEIVDEYLYHPYTSPYLVARLGEELLIKSGRIEEAYRRYAFRIPFQTTGLATFNAIRKKYTKISPQRILSDLIDADPCNERRYFAAARKIGMIELAVEIAEKYDVEPKTLTTACKDYIEKDPDLSLRFGLLALIRYAEGRGYEPEYADVQKCYDFVLKAAENAGKKEEVAEQIKAIVDNDKSVRQLVALVVNSRQEYGNNILLFRRR